MTSTARSMPNATELDQLLSSTYCFAHWLSLAPQALEGLLVSVCERLKGRQASRQLWQETLISQLLARYDVQGGPVERCNIVQHDRLVMMLDKLPHSYRVPCLLQGVFDMSSEAISELLARPHGEIELSLYMTHGIAERLSSRSRH